MRGQAHFRYVIAASALAVALCGVAPFATGALARGPRGAIAFEEIDANGDSVVTEDEFLAPMLERGTERFAVIDGDGDGVLTAEELESAPRPSRGRGDHN
jgi:hypothetical protein